MKEILIKKADVLAALKILVNPRHLGVLPLIISETSDEFHIFLEEFKSKDYLLIHHLLNMLTRIETSTTPLFLNLLTIDSDNIQSLTLPRDGLIILEVNLDNFSVETLQLFLQKITGLTLHSVRLQGGDTIPEAVLTSFIESITGVGLIHVSDTAAPTLKKISDEVTYRNQLIQLFGIKNMTNVWKQIIEKWASINPDIYFYQNSLNHVSYYKDLSGGDIRQYYNYLMKTYGLDHIQDVQINESTAKQVVLFDKINLLIRSLGLTFFEKMLDNYNEHLRINSYLADITLILNFELNNEHTVKLINYLQKNAGNLPFAKLSLQANKDFIQTDLFIELLKTLKSSGIQGLELMFLEPVTHDITDCLTTVFRDVVDFHVHITSTSKDEFPELEKMLIKQIQKNNIRYLFSDEKIIQPTEHKDDVIAIEGKQLFARKIKLKELMRQQNAHPEDYDDFIKLEVQHVEEQAVEQQQVIEIAVQKQAQVAVELQTFNGKLITFEDLKKQPYASFAKFGLLSFAWDTLKRECFGPLPKAIQYFSHEAAIEIMRNLPAFAPLNAHNLPQYFILKKTETGKLVLDYDAYAPEHEINVFTPKGFKKYEQREPIYKVDLDRVKVGEWIGNADLISEICFRVIVFDDSKLINLWIMYGDEGVKYFFKKINQLEIRHKGLPLFLVKHYLMHFLHWDQFLTDKSFIATLEKINYYDENKMTCLKKFLVDTGDSRHDLTDTVAAFEAFWDKVEMLCFKAEKEYAKDPQMNVKNLIQNINQSYSFLPKETIVTTWSTPKGGNPIVYMERLLTILENANDIKEQMENLGNIELNNYGAYYASKYEGFKLVADAMKFAPENRISSSEAFNPDELVYRVSLDQLYRWMDSDIALDKLWAANFGTMTIEKQEESYDRKYDRIPFEQWRIKNIIQSWLIKGTNATLSRDQVEAAVASGDAIPFSYENFVSPYSVYIQNVHSGIATLLIEQVPTRISNKAFEFLVWRFLGQQLKRVAFKPCLEAFDDAYRGDGSKQELFSALLFTSHIGGKKVSISLSSMYQTIKSTACHREVIYTINKYLYELYNRDIKLNCAEGSVLCGGIGMMNSSEFESLWFNKVEYIEKFFAHLKKNKYGAMRILNILFSMRSSKWPFTYALDTTEYLEQDVNIAVHYKEELPVFSLLINDTVKTAYYAPKKPKKKISCSPEAKANLLMVKKYLNLAAAQPKPNNLDHAIKTVVQAEQFFSYAKFLAAMQEINELPQLDFINVEKILRKYEFTVKYRVPEPFVGDSSELKNILINLILILTHLAGPSTQQNLEEKSTENSISSLGNSIISNLNQLLNSPLAYELERLDIPKLQIRFNEIWEKQGRLVTASGKMLMKPLFATLKNHMIEQPFKDLTPLSIVSTMKMNLKDLKDFSEYDTFEKNQRISEQAQTFAKLLNQIINRTNFQDQSEEITNLFSSIQYSQFDYEMLFVFLNFLNNQPQRHYAGTIRELFNIQNLVDNKELFIRMIDYCQSLLDANIPSVTIEKIIPFMGKNLNAEKLPVLVFAMTSQFIANSDDLILNFILNYLSIGLENAIAILSLKKQISEIHQSAFYRFLISLRQENGNLLDEFFKTLMNLDSDIQGKILEIISKAFVSGRVENNAINKIDYAALIRLLQALGNTKIDALYHFIQTSTTSAACLSESLNNLNPAKSFDEFLLELEKLPFGKRDLQQQFSTAECERVVNESKDMQNQTRFTYQRRKQLMEAVLFVNAIGLDIPVYHNKPAKDLSNLELKTLFQAVKSNSLNDLDTFQKLLYALGLMREAMYRATGEMPYITQIIALVDSIMHASDVISNIDTGQGKSLVDTMKGAVLWLMSDCVDITTSSLIDAKRQIELYAPFLELLGIPHTPKAITSASKFTDYQVDGVNFSTFPSLALFLSRARADDFIFNTRSNKVSLVINESDHAILDDRTIYRSAVRDGCGVGYGNEWVYYAINDFIETPEFKLSDTSDEQDFTSLRNFLIKKARLQEKSPRIIQKFDDDQLLTWIESAIIVRYQLTENFKYVIPPETESKFINGKLVDTKSIKILLKDGKISPDTTYGNGIQQLLYAYLNSKLNAEKYIIEQESKTIISTNNKTLIEFYQSKNGFIWGSSGTVGSKREIDEQYSKYGFDFTRMPPHQKNIVKHHQPILFEDGAEHFAGIIKLVHQLRTKNKNHISIVFCKDIETAQELFAELQRKHGDQYATSSKLFTGVGDEEAIVKAAAVPGMITITTSALGRNTDILYPRALGMTVIQAYPDSLRGNNQKGGRTARQGSPGDVYYLLNKQDINGKTLEAIGAEIEAKGAQERTFNEDLYNVIGYLLSVIDQLPSESFKSRKNIFFRKEWAKFTNETELSYREAKLNNNYSQEAFVNETLRLFNQLLADSLQPEALISIRSVDVLNYLNRKALAHAEYQVYQKDVKISDCTPASVIAYQFIPDHQDNSILSIIKDDVKRKLHELFTCLQKNKKVDINKDYFTYLNANNQTLSVIREAHQEFLGEFLENTVKNAANNNFIKRLLGLAPKLNKIANDKNYLFMFKAMTDINNNQPVVSSTELKPLLITLLDQYLQNNWFINSDRKKCVAALKTAINNASTIDDLFAALNDGQSTALGNDIAANKNSFWRRIKPLNSSGNSRLQNTLMDGLVLLSALTSKEINMSMAKGLAAQLKSVTKNIAALHAFETNPTYDNFHSTKSTLKFNDKANAKVVKTNLEKTLENNLSFSTPVTLSGRLPLFQYAPKIQIEYRDEKESFGNNSL